jgi:general secretion pathway protein F
MESTQVSDDGSRLSAAELSRPLSSGDLVTLNDEIAGMARAGLPLDQGLAALAREMRSGRLRRVTSEIALDLKAGHTLPEALDRQAGRVPDFYASVIMAGIRSGRLPEVLATLTVHARAIADLRATVLGSVFYPAVVLVFAYALFALLCFIIPQFGRIFQDFGINLPLVTQWALSVGNHPVEFGLLPPLAIVLGLLLARLSLIGSAGGRRAWARFVYAVPIIGTLIRSSRLAAFTDLLAILLEHAVPLPEAFRLAGQASSDPLMAEAAREVEADLKGGMPLGESLRTRRLVPPLVAWMTAMGERRGRLADSLHHAAEVYRRQAEMRAILLRSVLPPFMIIGTAAILVGFFVLALFLPLVKLISELSG